MEPQDRIAVILFAFICGLLYFNSLTNDFVFDDRHAILNNTYIKDLRYIPLFFKGHFTSFPAPKGMFRPLLMLTFSFNYLFSGLVPLGYHIINILFHFLNGVLLYSILRFFFKKAKTGLILLVTSLFLAHPINVEAVSYIISRSDLLVTLCMGFGILSYVREKKALALLCYAAALLSKETAVAFGLFIVLYDFIYEWFDYRDPKSVKAWFKTKAAFYVSLFALTIIYLWYRQVIFGGVGNLHPTRSLYSNILTQSMVTLYYFRLFLWPVPLSVHHNVPILQSLSEPLANLSVLFIGLLLIGIFTFRKKNPAISFGIGWILAGLAPKFYGTLNVVASEHHFYLASIGVYLIIIALTQGLYSKYRRYFIYCACSIIAAFAIVSFFRNFQWKDGLTLWRVEVKNSPSSAIARNNLGFEYLKAGLYQQAEREISKVFSLQSITDTDVSATLNLTAIRRIQGRYEEALVELERVRKRYPTYVGVYNDIGIIYESMGKFEEAEQAWKEGLRIYPSLPELNTNLGFLYYVRGKNELAQDCFEAALRYSPDFSLAFFGLGQVLETKGQDAKAIKAYEKSVKLEPGYSKSHYALGTLYAKKADPRALRELTEAVRLEPTFAAAHNNLAVLYASMDPARLELAREHAQRALLLGYKVENEFLRIIGLKEK